jgi:RNA polymerase sigma-70 factor (ECF subfamily)
MLSLGVTWRPAEINGQPGALFLDPEGDLVFVVSLDIVDSVQAVRAISNPEKLHHLGRVPDALARPRGPDAPAPLERE